MFLENIALKMILGIAKELFSVGVPKSINFGQVLYGGDKLFKGKEYDENNWTKDSIRGFLFKSVLDLASNFELELENTKNICR